MCGILCLVRHNTNSGVLELFRSCCDQIIKRGPDSFNEVDLETVNNYAIYLVASVLWLQGNKITKQPINNDKSGFIYNGDVFGGSAISQEQKESLGDTVLFLNELENKKENLVDLLSKINGPYSFIWFNKLENKVYFARDPSGRRSLLISQFIDKTFILTSTAVRHLENTCGFIELPAIGIFCFDLQEMTFQLFPWKKQHKNFEANLSSLKEFLKVNIKINNLQRESITDCGNSSFTEPNDTELAIFSQIKSLSASEAFVFLLNDKKWLENVLRLKEKLEKALELRIRTQPKYCKDCIVTLKDNCIHCRVGILFSGGLDCTILAFLADAFLDSKTPIDLFNVAFSINQQFDTPDRQTGLKSFDELKRLKPERHWNFVPIDKSYNELNLAKSKSIADVIYPLNTVLDDDLGCALWFASSGASKNYESPCRVLLVGMGADELFGGYTKHRAAFMRGGFPELHKSLEDDWQNISFRNLARDDRVVSDHGRQLRTPYLDEEVVDFVLSLKVWERTFPSKDMPQGFGDKILLRTLAYHLGLKETCTFQKRALQFGSRIADKKQRGHEVSKSLLL